jgi:glycosyltransferase involved in cell wall biosynthesis
MSIKHRKILLYTHALTGGGAERVWALLASELSERGHNVLFVSDFAASENSAFLNAKVRQTVLPKGHWNAVIGLAKLIKSERPDVSVSAIGVSNFKHVLAAIFARSLSRTIISMHGYYSSEPGTVSRMGNALTPLFGRITAATICVSDGLIDYFANTWFLPRSKATRIYNPVMVTAKAPPPSLEELSARAPIILAVGRLVDYKNYPMLLQAFAKLKTKNAVLNILGEGPDRALIEALIVKLGIETRVKMLGYQASPWDYYASAKCFALPSNSESFGNVVVEALAQGLPVIATKCHGPLEIITNASFGTLVERGDSDAMAVALDAILANPNDPAPRIAHAQNFTSDAAAQAYEAVFEKVIAGTLLIKPFGNTF